jgi:hypothetical protein
MPSISRDYLETTKDGIFSQALPATYCPNPIGCSTFSGGIIHVLQGEAAATLTFYSQCGGVWYLLKDSSGANVTLSVTGGAAYAIPDACFGALIVGVQSSNLAGTKNRVTLKG